MISIRQTRAGAFTIILFLFCLFLNPLQAQEIDILLKGGHVIDPKNKIDSKMDEKSRR